MARRLFGLAKEGLCQKQNQKCPECRKIVKGYVEDPRIREISVQLTLFLDRLESAQRASQLEASRISSFSDDKNAKRPIPPLRLFNDLLTQFRDKGVEISSELSTIPPDLNRLQSLAKAEQDHALLTIWPRIKEWLSLDISLQNADEIRAWLNDRENWKRYFDEISSLFLLSPKLKVLPPEIIHWANGPSLFIRSNHLRSLPCEIKFFWGEIVTELHLLNNKFSTFPVEICALRFLHRLEMDNNQLRSLPDEIGSMPFLSELELADNKLRSLPDTIGSLQRLKRLELQNNELTALPDTLGNLSELEVLELANNRLQALPDSLCSLPKLRVLHLGNNKLTSLPAPIDSLTPLERLEIQGNQLSSLPEALVDLPQLQGLFVDKNPFLFISKKIRDKMDKPAFDAREIHERVLVEYARSLLAIWSKLKERIPEAPELQAVEEIRAWLNDINNVPFLNKITELNLSGLSLKALPPEISKLTQLEWLFLSRNALTFLPDEMGALSRLQRLDLSYNYFSSLPETIGDLTKLQVLDLSHNQLSSLPDAIGKLTQLTWLALTNNRLHCLPETIVHLTQLQSLGLKNNPLSSIAGTILDVKIAGVEYNDMIIKFKKLNRSNRV